MIRATFWKEWREHRLKYGAYWLALNLPILTTAICVALNKGARTPFADLSDVTAIKYLGLAMVAECYAIATVFMLVTGFLAAATFSPEQEDRSVFFSLRTTGGALEVSGQQNAAWTAANRRGDRIRGTVRAAAGMAADACRR